MIKREKQIFFAQFSLWFHLFLLEFADILEYATFLAISSETVSFHFFASLHIVSSVKKHSKPIRTKQLDSMLPSGMYTEMRIRNLTQKLLESEKNRIIKIHILKYNRNNRLTDAREQHIRNAQRVLAVVAKLNRRSVCDAYIIADND